MALRKPSHDLEQVKAEYLHRKACRSDLTTWCEHALKPLDQAPAAHHRLLLSYLAKVASGEIKRLIVNLPPGSAKSTYVSLLFPAFFMAANRNVNVIGLSYASDLAEKFSGQLRNLIGEHATVLGFDILPQSRSRELWHTTNGCEYRCAGITGGITGFRADIAIVDDPIRNWADAFSPVIKEMIWAEFQASVLTRLKPGGSIVVVQTRWAEDDLSGRLMEEQPDQWTILHLPALCEDDDDPMGRAIGQCLWPSYQTPAMMENLRSTLSDLVWSGLYQQRPRGMTSSLFQVQSMPIVKLIPSTTTIDVRVRHWDLAGTAEAEGRRPDWTVGILMARTTAGSWMVEDMVRFRGDPSTVESVLRETAMKDGRDVRIGIPQDPGAAGKSNFMFLARALAGYRVEAVPQSGSKVTRAMPATSQCNAGNISFLEGAWNSAFLSEMASFPGGRHDDVPDAFSSAFNALVAPAIRSHMVNTNLTSR